MIKYFAGIDVQIKRGCCYYIIDENKKYVASGWIIDNIPQSFKELFFQTCRHNPNELAIGIDAPRMPTEKLRTRYFDKTNNIWIEKSNASKGRECEVIIKSYNITNPQWTRTYEESPEWMKLGFLIFNSLKEFPFVYEVFCLSLLKCEMNLSVLD
jgi:hypothetical protein